MKNRDRKRPKGDKYALMREAQGVNVTNQVKPRTRVKGAEPEAILQADVSGYLHLANIFELRLSEHVYRKAADWTIAGWPDSPMIFRLPHGVALLAPLELKKEGEVMNPSQVAMAPIIGTQVADTWDKAEAYIKHAQYMAEYIRQLLRDNPPPFALKTEEYR